jgi:hypothetical protein
MIFAWYWRVVIFEGCLLRPALGIVKPGAPEGFGSLPIQCIMQRGILVHHLALIAPDC